MKKIIEETLMFAGSCSACLIAIIGSGFYIIKLINNLGIVAVP